MDLNNYLYEAVKKCISRNTAQIIEENDEGIIIVNDGILMIATDNNELAKNWLDKYHGLKHDILSIMGDESVSDYAQEKYGYKGCKKTYQVVYTKPEPPKRLTDLKIRLAKPSDFSLIGKNYDMTYEDLLVLIKEERIFVGENSECAVGFIGEHSEGSMGILFVKEEYRKHGYAYDLEAFMIERQMNMGYVPFGNIVVNNDKSLALQKKMGLEIVDGFIYWLFLENLA